MADNSASPVHPTPLAALSSIITAIPSAREPGRVAALSRCGSPVALPSTQAAGTSATMSGKKNRRAPSATPWDDLPESQITPSQAIVKAARDGICSFRCERFSGGRRLLQRLPQERVPALRLGQGQAQRRQPQRGPGLPLPVLRQDLHTHRRHHLRRLEAAGHGVGRLHLAGSPSRARPTTPSCSRDSQTSSTRSSRSTACASC